MPTTYVLIHGAWHGDWAWRPVATELRAAGHRVIAPTLPGLNDGEDPTGYHLGDVVDFVVDLVESADLHDVALVGHSWGGWMAAAAAPRIAGRLSKLVFLSAFFPADGCSLMDETPGVRELYEGLARASGNNTVMVPYELLRSFLMADATDEVARLAHSLLSPQPFQYFTETVPAPHPASLGVPFSYVLGSAEGTEIAGGGLGLVIERLGVSPVLVPGGHEALLLHPAEVAKALLDA